MMRILALEASTTSAKAMFYNTDTGSIRVETKEYGKMYEDQILHAPEIVFEKMMEAGYKVLNGERADVISLGGTWHSVGLFSMERECTPITPIYQWSYTGASKICKELRMDEKYVNNFYHTTGCMVNAIYPFFKLHLLRQQGYALEEYRIMGQGTYNTYRLTDEYVVTQCMASGSGLLNIKKREYDAELVEALGITERNLPKVIEAGISYPLNKTSADMLGIPSGIPVIPTNADGALNQIGAGALKKQMMTFSVGTSGALRFSVSQPNMRMGTWCYLTPKNYLSGAAVSGCCNCIDWFRDKVAGGRSYCELETGEGAEFDTPVFLPFLFGERCPGWKDERKGGFRELKAHHDDKALYRAIQEGILFNMYQCYQILTDINGEPECIRVSGGIGNSEIWLQMCADIFGKDIEVSNEQQESLMGAVIWAMDCMGIALAEDYEAAIKRIIVPNQKNTAIYRKKFTQYLKCYYAEEM